MVLLRVAYCFVSHSDERIAFRDKTGVYCSIGLSGLQPTEADKLKIINRIRTPHK